MVDTKEEVEFKLTEVGLIPEDWEVVPLGNIFNLKQGLQFSIDKQSNTPAIGLQRFIRIIDLTNPNEPRRYVKDPGTTYHVSENDLFMVRYGAPGLLGFGHTGIIANNLFRLLLKKNLYPRFYFYYLQFVNERILSISGSSTMPAINFSSLRNLLLIHPPSKAEQTAIATALHDADALIVQMEKLIAKKRAIKQGAMQRLLQPKKGWDVKVLGQVATLKARIGWQGLTTAEYKNNGDYYLITGTEFQNGFINWQRCYYVDELRYKQDKNIQIKKQDILVTKDGTIGKVALIKNVPKPATLNSGVFVVRPIEKSFNPDFFYYLLLSKVFKDFLSQLSAGSTIIHLYQKDFVSFKFSIPKTIDEQTHIATILSDMDVEIAALEQQLEKYKNIKQGMMQVLLTGKIRLV